MLILAIDNSIDLLNIAIAEGGKLLEERHIKDTRTPSEIMANAVSDILADSGHTIDDVDVIFVTLGPGSFTGIRVSLAFCKGISSSKKIPVIGVPTLDALALSLSHREGYFLCPLINARKGEVFISLYFVSKGTLKRLIDYRAVKPEVVSKIIQKPCICFGTGLTICEDILSATEGVTMEKDKYTMVSAEALIRAGIAMMTQPPDRKIKPIYGRRSEAEIKFNVTVD
jgi:tRNA threonylcarbamoyladenosine biosynthesis protein TsaB